MSRYRSCPMILAFAAALVLSPSAWPYGGGGGGSSGCDDPKFLKADPADGSTVTSLSEFKFLASDTDVSTLNVEINGTAASPDIKALGNGDLQVTIKPEAPIVQPGKVRITARGRSKEGCEGFTAFYIAIKP